MFYFYFIFTSYCHECDRENIVCLDTGVLRTGGVGTVIILGNYTHTLALIPKVTFTQSWLPSHWGDCSWSCWKCWFCAFLVLAVAHLGYQWPSPQASLGFFRCISKELPPFPGTFPILQTCFSPSKYYVCRNTCDLPLRWGFCLMVWRVSFYSWENLVYATSVYSRCYYLLQQVRTGWTKQIVDLCLRIQKLSSGHSPPHPYGYLLPVDVNNLRYFLSTTFTRINI